MIFTSDLHFWHNRVIEFCPKYRPYTTLEEMNADLITKWNKAVSKKGTKVYHLGDFSFGTPEQTEEILSQLRGDITFIAGNHDYSTYKKVLCKYGDVKDYTTVKYNKKLFILMHYPLLDWRNKGKGSIMLHGHLHGNIKDTEESRGKTMDVGYDAVGKFLTADEILAIMESREINPIGHHN